MGHVHRREHCSAPWSAWRWPNILQLISSGGVRPHPNKIREDVRFGSTSYLAAVIVRHIREMMHHPTDSGFAFISYGGITST
jgi:hypothetical protein